MAQIYYVSPMGNDRAPGTLDAPFRTIGHAASIAQPGDTVRVREGVYREWVSPALGGLNDGQRITYEAMPGEHPVIKGSEIIKGWTRLEDTVWQVTLENTLFGDWNPFAQPIGGDWLLSPREEPVHTGDVYLNGKSLYEARSLTEVKKAEKRVSGHQAPGFRETLPIHDPGATIYQWYAEVGPETTILTANFQGFDPNVELVEINVRMCCFYPRQTGVNYITVRGFEMCHAACPFTPPTADQPGIVGPHWAKGWIIENNHLHDAKCSAVSLGKEISTGHNLYSLHDRKPGYQYQMEAVFRGLQIGWSKEKIGGHIVRNNLIHDCGQNGIVGHMGGAFSRIQHNHIWNIAVKREFYGYEIAAIKLHAAIDTVIEDNLLHHSETGLWLDWQAQGTRVTRNIFFYNDRDVWIEVTHGPCTLDSNILGSPYALSNAAQGTAFVHNLICGCICHYWVRDRATPYHFPHSTQVAGCAVVYSGDDRMYNNLFTGVSEPADPWCTMGTLSADRYIPPEEYAPRLAAEGDTNEQKYYKVPQPIWLEGNAYADLARPCKYERDPLQMETLPLDIRMEGDACVMDVDVPERIVSHRCMPVTTQRLGAPRITEQPYEAPDGSPIDFARALDGVRETAHPGPFAHLKTGRQRIVLWQPQTEGGV